MGRHIASKLVASVQDQVHHLIEVGEKKVVEKVESIRLRAQKEMETSINAELSRLQALKAINPNIRDDELTVLEQQIAELRQYITQAQYQLDSLRMIVVSHN